LGLLLVSSFYNFSLVQAASEASIAASAARAQESAETSLTDTDEHCAAPSCDSRGATAGPVLLQKAAKKSKTTPELDVEVALEHYTAAVEHTKTHTLVLANKPSGSQFAEDLPGDGVPDKKMDKAMKEAEKEEDKTAALAPTWSQCLLLFFAFAFGIFITMVIILTLLQLVVNRVEHMNDLKMAKLAAASAATRPKLQHQPSMKPSKGKTAREVSEEISAEELAAFMNKDHTRVEQLLSIADSQAPETRLQQLVQKASTAYKLKLSAKALTSASTGLQALMMAVSDKHKKQADAKAKFQKSVSKVQLLDLLNAPVHKDHQEQHSWIESHGHSENAKDKYDDGHKDSLHGKFQDARKAKFEKGSWAAYFASETWIDHTAIAFVFVYSQTCAFVYAMYLKTRFPLMYQFMGPWLLVSRGEAMAAIVLSTLMVMLLSRGLLTQMRRFMSWSTVLQTIADKSVLIHKSIGMMLVFCAFFHVLGHFRGSIPAIIGETDSSEINKAFTYGTKIKFNFNTWAGALQCFPAVTGVLLVLILVGFWALSNEKVRRKSFELFHYPHLILMFLWCGTLIAHGWKQWLGVGVPLASLSVAPALLYYACERLVHISRGSNPHIRISNAIIKKRTVKMEIDTGSTGYAYETGMYCMLKCPEISNFQWHPFTIASGGGRQSFQVIFAVVGDWTTGLKDLIKKAQDTQGPYPTICARGGYGAPAASMKDHEHIVMVGGGVGATPFLSFLSNVSHSALARGKQDYFVNLKSAAFFWVSREPDDFLWVNEYASIIRDEPSLRDRVEIHLCLTKTLDSVACDDCGATEVALFWVGVDVALNKLDSEELRSDLGVPTQFGRPNWYKELSTHLEGVKKRHAEVPEVSVFACGNAMLVASLEEGCAAASDTDTTFRLYAEEF